ncbi:MAG TPA: adenylosuccinate lyase [Chitinivibrionales bacterium]|nr:adenylosuccinate lyase [Chitinivibrionales bacterium]
MNKKNNSTTALYSNPLLERYAGSEMSYVFSPDFKFGTWRKLWVALAECEMELGLPIKQEQVGEMRAHLTDIDYEAAKKYEAKTRHDVMAHILAFGDRCPAAKPIIHLGATSAFVGDNTDLIQMKEAVLILLKRLAAVIAALRKFALKNRALATLGFTHFQPAQLTTVGKRASLWLYDLCMDFEELERFCGTLPFLGVKGTTGTQASYMSLFNGDAARVKKLDKMVARKMGFDRAVPVSGQTYSRKIDASALAAVSGIAQTFHKISNDIRLLMHLREIEEPFESGQVGSSAMAYKRNPMRSERMTSLSRYIISLSSSPANTAAEQWLERTLDDSANKRLSIPEAFLAADAILIIGLNVLSGLVVYPRVIARHVAEELPFMATETILMEAVKKGGDRQALHERIRRHSMEAGNNIKLHGKPNDLLERIVADPAFRLKKKDLDRILDVSAFVGRAPQQVDEFVKEYVDPLLERGKKLGSIKKKDLTV